MKIIKPSYEILTTIDGNFFLEFIEVCGRTCYKSEDRITEDSAKKFVAGIIKSGHHSVIEHVNITVRFVCDRGISHELVRHRLASYSQESTRYCNYSTDKFDSQITVILPVGFDDRLAETEYPDGVIESIFFELYQNVTDTEQEDWLLACEYAEARYFSMIKRGAKPEIARNVLPNSLKTEVVMTCNLREWKHVFRMRCQKAAHPQIRELLLPLLKELHEKIPVVFDEEYAMFYWTKDELDEAKAWARKTVKNLSIVDTPESKTVNTDILQWDTIKSNEQRCSGCIFHSVKDAGDGIGGERIFTVICLAVKRGLSKGYLHSEKEANEIIKPDWCPGKKYGDENEKD